MKRLPILYPLLGTIIGSSFFTLPFIFKDQALILSISLFLLISLLSTYSNYIYSKIILNTHGKHQLPGYTEIYLGHNFKPIASLIILLGGLGSNLAYIIIISSFFKILFPTLLISDTVFAIFFVLIFGTITYSGSMFRKLEKYFTTLLICLLAFISIYLIFNSNTLTTLINLTNINVHMDKILLLLGIALASNTGFSILPELKQTLKNSDLKKTIALNSFAPVILYFLFIIGVISSSNIVSENSLSGLVAPELIILITVIIGILAITTSYESISVVSIETLKNDFHFPHFFSFLLVVLFPLIFFLSGIKQLVLVTAVVGGLFTALSHIIVQLIYRKTFNHSKLLEFFEAILIYMVISEIIFILYSLF